MLAKGVWGADVCRIDVAGNDGKYILTGCKQRGGRGARKEEEGGKDERRDVGT